MFKCDLCSELIGPNIKCNIVPAKTRKKVYNLGKREVVGWEIVKEYKLCPQCTPLHDYKTPEMEQDYSIRIFGRLNYNILYKMKRKTRSMHDTQVSGSVRKRKKNKSRDNSQRRKPDIWKNFKFKGGKR